jgi:hypothetical protein
MELLRKPDYTQGELMHEEIKMRAYRLLEKKYLWASGDNLDDELNGELPHIAYAISVVQGRGEKNIGDDRSYRAARIYLRALTSFVAWRKKSPGETYP